MKVFVITFLLLVGAQVPAQSPAAIETELLGYLKTMVDNGSYGGAFDENKRGEASRALKEKLKNYATRADVLSYDFPKLREKMFVTTSKDKKFRIYSWDLQSGGTMYKHDAIIQYVGQSGKVNAFSSIDFGGGQAFYVDIFQMSTAHSSIYILIWNATVESNTHGQGLETVRVVADKLDLDAKVIRLPEGVMTQTILFYYDYLSVAHRAERPVRLFTFNEARREFSYPVVDVEDKEWPLGRVTNKQITYRFNGTHFVKVR